MTHNPIPTPRDPEDLSAYYFPEHRQHFRSTPERNKSCDRLSIKTTMKQTIGKVSSTAARSTTPTSPGPGRTARSA